MTSKAGREWSDEDLATLRREYGTKRIVDLAADLGRSPGSIETQAVRLGLTQKRQKRGHGGRSASVIPERLQEQFRDAAARADYTPTIRTELLGEPPPGRSALDGWIQRGREEQPDPHTIARSRPWHPLRDGKREVA